MKLRKSCSTRTLLLGLAVIGILLGYRAEVLRRTQRAFVTLRANYPLLKTEPESIHSSQLHLLVTGFNVGYVSFPQEPRLSCHDAELLQDLKGLHTLEAISGIEDRQLKCFPKLTSVRCIDFRFAEHVTDAGVDALAEACPNLRLLRLQHSSISDAVADSIAGLSRLEELDLSQSPHLTDRALNRLVSCKQLASLSLDRTQVTWQETDPFVRETQLTVLNCNSTPVTDVGFKAISQIATIRRLFLWDTMVTNECFSSISRWTHLQELVISSPHMDPNSTEVEKFKQCHPRCQVTVVKLSSSRGERDMSK